MQSTTLASTHRALEHAGAFLTPGDYAALKAVGRTFAQRAAVLAGFRRSIPVRYKKKGKQRTAALELHARSLGRLAEPYLLRALREDPSQGTRGAAAQWLVRIAHRSDEDVRSRLYGVLVERYDAEAHMMDVRAALAESLSYDALELQRLFPGRALTTAALESSAKRARDAQLAPARRARSEAARAAADAELQEKQARDKQRQLSESDFLNRFRNRRRLYGQRLQDPGATMDEIHDVVMWLEHYALPKAQRLCSQMTKDIEVELHVARICLRLRRSTPARELARDAA